MMINTFRYVTSMGLLVVATTATAGTEMFVCTSADGVRTYQNKDGGAGCVPLNLNPVTVVPASRPMTPSGSSGFSGDSKKSDGTPDSSYDKSNDYLADTAKSDRLKILREELRLEEGKLQNLQNEYKNGQPDRLGNEKNYQKYLDRTKMLQEEIQSSQDNIAVIKREIDRMKK